MKKHVFRIKGKDKPDNFVNHDVEFNYENEGHLELKCRMHECIILTIGYYGTYIHPNSCLYINHKDIPYDKSWENFNI